MSTVEGTTGRSKSGLSGNGEVRLYWVSHSKDITTSFAMPR